MSRSDVKGDEPLTALETVKLLDAEYPLIEREPGRCAGQPTIKGTRMRVSDVLCAIAQYADIQPALDNWEREDYHYPEGSWKEALYYAADYITKTVPLDRGEGEVCK